MEWSFPPKIRTTMKAAILVQWGIKALGGIKIVMNPISTDCTFVDLMIVTLMALGSTGWNLEVIVIPWNVLKWSWGPSSDWQSVDLFFHLNVIVFFFSSLKMNSSSEKTNVLWIIFQSASLFYATAVRWHPFSRLITLSLVNICCSHCSLQLDIS